MVYESLDWLNGLHMLLAQWVMYAIHVTSVLIRNEVWVCHQFGFAGNFDFNPFKLMGLFT